MSGFEAEESAFAAASAQIGSVADEADAEFSRVQQAMTELLGGSWTGAASRAFAGGWESWELGYRDAMMALRSMGTLLAQTGAGYGQVESGNSAGLNGIAGDIGGAP